MATITVVIPTIPGREDMLNRALASVDAQKRQPDEVLVVTDPGRTGAAATRNRALAKVETEFILWLDDDDELLPNHLRGLAATQAKHEADVVYSPWSGINTRLFDPELFVTQWGEEHTRLQMAGNFLPITTLIRTQVMRDVGGFTEAPRGVFLGEDATMYQRLLKAGAKFACHPVVTWHWHGHPGHTSGRGL